jgi:hypothetical protein
MAELGSTNAGVFGEEHPPGDYQADTTVVTTERIP